MPTSPITDDHKHTFDRDGYVRVPGLIPPEEIAELRQAYDRLVREAEEANGGARRGRMIQRSGMASADPSWRDRPYMATILAAGRALMGEDIVFSYDQIIMKPPHYPATTPWHQDAGYWRGNPHASTRALTCWLALSEVTETHGCMQFVPGSHRGKIVHHADARDRSEINVALEAEVDERRAVKVPLQPGDATFHHCRTLHFTAGNAAATPRCGLITHLFPQAALDWQKQG